MASSRTSNAFGDAIRVSNSSSDLVSRRLQNTIAAVEELHRMDMSRTSRSSALASFEHEMGEVHQLVNQWTVALKKDEKRQKKAQALIRAADKAAAGGFYR